MPRAQASRTVIGHTIAVPKGEVRVYDYVGDDPAVVMTHGFPDDSRIYLRLVDELASRRVITFDFLGYGRSSREAVWPLRPGQREAELAAVIDALALTDPILVGHDSGGPVVINYALEHPSRVSALVLLNTYYGHAPALQFPELIRLLADPDLRPLADAMLDEPAQREWLLLHTRRRFHYDPHAPDGVGRFSVQPQFFGDEEQPDALASIRAWTAELFADLKHQDRQLASGVLGIARFPVTLAFGARDPYLNLDVARHICRQIAGAVVDEVPDASHWPQWDQPATVAQAILRASAGDPPDFRDKTGAGV
jgi:haloalkane dehalogenase